MKISKIMLGLALFLLLPLQAPAYWSAVEPGLDSWGQSATVYEGSLIVGGYFGNPGEVMAPAVARWDGTNWSPLGSGIPRGYPCALTVYDGKLIAGGSFLQAGSALQANHVGQWDGATWQPMGSGMDGSVFALAVYRGNLIAGGGFTSADGKGAAGIARWDGSSWSPLGSGVDGYVGALAVYDGKLIAGGWFTHAGGVTVNNIAQWDGESWSSLGSGITDLSSSVEWGPAVWALTVYEDKVIAGGLFAAAGEVSTNNIAQWDGASWSGLGLGVTGGTILDGAIGSLAVYQGDLIAGGLFERAGGIEAGNIARWDGQSWSSMDSGADSGVLGLAVYDGSLVAVGAFSLAGGQETGYIARWEKGQGPGSAGGPSSSSGRRYLPSSSGPGLPPMAGVVRAASVNSGTEGSASGPARLYTFGRIITLDLKTSSPVCLDIFNPAGARVRRLIDEQVSSGRWQFWWNGRDDRGNNQGSGVYFCRLSTVTGRNTAKLVFAR